MIIVDIALKVCGINVSAAIESIMLIFVCFFLEILYMISGIPLKNAYWPFVYEMIGRKRTSNETKKNKLKCRLINIDAW